jgi:tRNA/rRNA methyltransferase
MAASGDNRPIHLVLVEPAGPLNVGSVARLCANFAIAELRLVAPRCDPLDPQAQRMAVHGRPLLERARRFERLADALADCGRVVATSGRREGEPLALQGPAEALAWLLADGGGAGSGGAGPSPAAIVFGREDRGLSNGELLQAGRLLCLDTGDAYTSLNLSHAVAVVLHELHRLRRGSPDAPARCADGAEAGANPAARGELEAALADAEALLLEVGFLLPHTARARMAKLRALLQRAQVQPGELALLRGMVCQLRWASRRPCPPSQDH